MGNRGRTAIAESMEKPGGINFSRIIVAVALLWQMGCAVSMRKSLPGVETDPETAVARLDSLTRSLQTDKQIIRVRLLDKGRTFSGDGALMYRAPDTLQLSIYGPPFSTLWLQLLTRGDSVLVVLPKDNRIVRASRTDPQPVTRLAGSEGLSDAVFLGGVTGIFQLERFRCPGMKIIAATDGRLCRLRLFNDSTAYEFVFDSGLDAVVQFLHYDRGKKSREIIRSDFKPVGSLQRATKTIYRDYLQDREITVLVSKEEVNPELTEGAFKILLPEGAN